MKYIIDNDLHIHTRLSPCSSDPAQNPGAILEYAKKNGLKNICVADHFWDAAVPCGLDDYRPLDLELVSRNLPLPQADGIRFRFGCETELDKDLTLGIARQTMDKFDFVIIPTTHLHFMGFTIAPEDDAPERRAYQYEKRLDAVLDMDLPFWKIGIPHLTCSLMAPGSHENHLKVMDMIPDMTLRRLYTKLRDKGAGFELNFDFFGYSKSEQARALRPYYIARDCGCRFYFGSDAHHPKALEEAPANFRAIAQALELTEDMKFTIAE